MTCWVAYTFFLYFYKLEISGQLKYIFEICILCCIFIYREPIPTPLHPRIKDSTDQLDPQWLVSARQEIWDLRDTATECTCQFAAMTMMVTHGYKDARSRTAWHVHRRPPRHAKHRGVTLWCRGTENALGSDAREQVGRWGGVKTRKTNWNDVFRRKLGWNYNYILCLYVLHVHP
jgi:hypothetical protein